MENNTRLWNLSNESAMSEGCHQSSLFESAIKSRVLHVHQTQLGCPALIKSLFFCVCTSKSKHLSLNLFRKIPVLAAMNKFLSDLFLILSTLHTEIPGSPATGRVRQLIGSPSTLTLVSKMHELLTTCEDKHKKQVGVSTVVPRGNRGVSDAFFGT